jgi:hypothetical protein
MKRHEWFALIYGVSLLQIPISLCAYIALDWHWAAYVAFYGGIPAVLVAVTGAIEPKENEDAQA